MKIFSLPNSYRYIKQLDDSGLLSLLIPETDLSRDVALEYYLRGGVWGHSLDTLAEIEKIFLTLKKKFPKFNLSLENYLEEKISGCSPRKSLLKLAAILHDLGKPPTLKKIKGRVRFFGHEEKGEAMVSKIAQRLRLSRQERRLLMLFTLHHMRPANLSKQKELTERAIYRYFRDLGGEGVGTLLISLADVFTYEQNKRHFSLTKEMLASYYLKKEKVKPLRLIDGHDLMRYLKIQSGPVIGKILNSVEEAQALGKVKTKQEALDWGEKCKTQSEKRKV